MTLRLWFELMMFVFPYFSKATIKYHVTEPTSRYMNCLFSWLVSMSARVLQQELTLYCTFWKHLKALWNSTLYVIQCSFWIGKHRDILDTDHRYMKNVITCTRCSYLNWGDTKKAGLCYFQDTESCGEGLKTWQEWTTRWISGILHLKRRDFQVRCVRRFPVWCKPFVIGTVTCWFDYDAAWGMLSSSRSTVHSRPWPWTVMTSMVRPAQVESKLGNCTVRTFWLDLLSIWYTNFPEIIVMLCVLNSSRYQHGRHLPVRLRGQTLQ